MRVAVVKAAHDDDAGVWYVEHSDMEGLHAEGETFECSCRNVETRSPISLRPAGRAMSRLKSSHTPP